MKRVVITGMGIISPVGSSLNEFWGHLINGDSGIAPVTRFDPKNHKIRLAAEVKNFDPLIYMEKSESARFDPYIQYALGAVAQAVTDSGAFPVSDPLRYGVYFGSALGGMETFIREHGRLQAHGPRRVSPFFVPMMISNMASGLIAIRYNCRGIVMPSVTACATGATAIGEAYEKIRYGFADVMIAGGADAAINECSVAGFTNMKALSTSEDVCQASLPFDKRRNGFVLGEGAAAVILEEYEHALRRNARIYAEIKGYGVSCDAYHIASPRPDGSVSAVAIQEAVRQANKGEDDTVYVNAHGTGTHAGDIAEVHALEQVFGSEAGRCLISSTKSMTGHMLGAAGAAEAIVCVQALREGLIPPTINLLEPDPECGTDFDFVPLKTRNARITLAVSNSFGFGGHNVSLALRNV